MNSLAKISAIAAGLALSGLPCLTAAASAAPSVEQVDFDLQRHSAATGALSSLTLAASLQTAAETQDEPRRSGPSTTTWLVIGGVALLVLVAVAVASAAPTPGPREGAFD